LLFLIAVGFFTFRIVSVRHYAGHAPEALNVGRALVYDPGCSFLWCSGGALYKFDRDVAGEISVNGMDWFKSRTDINISKNDKPIGSWEYVVADDLRISSNTFYEFYPGFYKKRNHHTSKFRKAVKNGNFYLSNQYSQPIILVIPDEQLVYIGWFD